MTEDTIEYRFIDSDSLLKERCTHWLTCSVIALDTEFIRVDTFYPKAALIQVQDNQGCWLIDPLTISDWGPFKQVLNAEQTLKVLHACSEDLDVFAKLTGTLPKPMMDTQVALAFLGETLSVGYQRMVESWLDISLQKEETRSDWLQRPLTQSQCAYAAADVFYLYKIWPKIEQKLQEQNRFDWCRQECAQIIRLSEQAPDDEFYFLRVKQAWKLNQEQLAVLQVLAAWREQEVRERNIPRGRLISDNLLWLIALKLPANRMELSRIEGIRHGTIKKDGDDILELVDIARNRAQAMWPASLPSPIGHPYRDWSKAMKKQVRQIAEAHNLPPELLVRKRQMEQVLNRAIRGELNFIPEEWRGWRESLVGQPLIDLLDKLRS
ncbi:ribonuclease D [Oceanospirillum linum]|uniref:Ribonuclease D n=1 Tax=Oceanospirillum linum TaxID=966 RepID=A0A1T1H8T7_OCELI|nr:ribonuclease D [Oceanospirillum linum]OOV86271.1 ribonuclease D [Oceanospirillum linum]SEG52602.1 ribonuclease D [Oleiphilus messinensis]SMP30518.1 ribonuclease D [Oceanospirillum linum]